MYIVRSFRVCRMIASSKLCKSMLVMEVTLTGYQTVSFVILNVTCVLFLLNAFDRKCGDGSLVHQPLSENLTFPHAHL